MTDRPKVTQAVFVVALTGDSVLLQLRQNTSWLDGWYDLPGGHIEPGESLTKAAVRELKEETSVVTLEKNLELFHISQNDAGSNHSNPYVYLMFRADTWEGKPSVGDPDKVGKVGFFPLDRLPEKTVPYVKRALKDITTKKVTFSYFGTDGQEQ